MNTQSFITIVCVFLGINAVKLMTGIGVIEILSYIKDLSIGIFSRQAGKNKIKNDEKFALMNKKDRKKNFSYKFYTFVNEILLDIGWRNKNITVEGFNMFILVMIGLFSILLYIVLNSFILTIVVSFVLWIVTYALIFLFSRMQHTYRKTALMDAEDFLCGSMSQGVVQAIEDNYRMMDRTIQPQFEDFLRSVYDRNVDVFTALDTLNSKCGEQFDDFCDKAKVYEREKRPGMEDVFQYNISRNAYVRELDRACAKTFGEMNRNFLASVGIVLGFVAYNMMAYQSIRDFYLSDFGKLLLVFYFLLISIAFIYLQYIQSKPFKFGK